MPGAMRLVDAFDEAPVAAPRRETTTLQRARPARPRTPLRIRVWVERILVAGVVVGVLVSLAAVPISLMISRHDRGHGAVYAAKEQIRIFATSLDMYQMDNGMYPSTQQGLQALLTQPASEPAPKRWRQYLNASSVPVDPWGHDYVYTHLDAHTFDIKSVGSDGLLDTEDDILKP